MKPPWQPQPPPPVQSVPGVRTGTNGRPPGSGAGQSTGPGEASAFPLGTVPKPQAGEITTQRPPAVAPQDPISYSFKVPSQVYPEIAVGRPTFNPLTGEWIIPRG